MISFETKVKRMQRWVLGSIVVLIAAGLVFSGTVGNPDQNEDDGQPAGALQGVKVSKKEYRMARAKAEAYARYMLLNSAGQAGRARNLGMILQYGKGVWNYLAMMSGTEGETAGSSLPRTPEEWNDKTWELLAVTFDARMKGLRVSEDEVDHELAFLLKTSRISHTSVREFNSMVAEVFGADPAIFREAVRDVLLVEKSLSYEYGGGVVKHAAVYDRLVGESRQAKVRVAAIDPEPFIQNPLPIGAEQIAARFDETRESYREPERVQVEALIAELATFRKTEPEPADEAVQKYYDDNKGQFKKLKPRDAHGHDDHDTPPGQDEYRPLEEVREEIVAKIKTKGARTAAYDVIRKVNAEVGRMLAAQEKQSKEEVTAEIEQANRAVEQARKDAKPEEEIKRLSDDAARMAADKDKTCAERVRKATVKWFGQIRRKFADEKVELAGEITVPFDAKHVDDAFKALGKPEKDAGKEAFKEFAFSKAEGEIDAGTLETDRGFAILRIAGKIEAYVPDLTDPIRAKITKELAVSSSSQRTLDLANAVKQGLELRPEGVARLLGLRLVEEKHALAFRQSSYFGATSARQPQGMLDIGLGESGLASAVREQVFQSQGGRNPLTGAVEAAPEPRIGDVFVIGGSKVGADRSNWAYVGVVEDVVAGELQGADDQLTEQRRQLEEKELPKFRMDHLRAIRNMVTVDDLMKSTLPAATATPVDAEEDGP